MAVGFKAGHFWYSVGTGSFLHSFFSTISYHLEPNGWGTKYPYLMKDLYNGKIENCFIPDVLKEINEIRTLLEGFKPNEVIWDIEDLSQKPPWGNHISPTITSLANYFVTSGGGDLFEHLIAALKCAIEYDFDCEIMSL